MPLVLADGSRVGLVAAELVLNRLHARPTARLLPTGRTPDSMHAALRAHAAARRLPSGNATVLQLDEYAGVAPGDPRRLRRAAARGARRRAARHPGDARRLGPRPRRRSGSPRGPVEGAPLDLAVLGLGRDGHVASTSHLPLASGVREVALIEETRTDAADAFGGLAGVPTAALTVGLGTLWRVRELLLLATGSLKAAALRAALEEPVSPECPASLLRDRPRLTVICDRGAAALLTARPQFTSDRVLVVLGHRDPGTGRRRRALSMKEAELSRRLR
jgi:glucosamine-6-phosphate deaminase